MYVCSELHTVKNIYGNYNCKIWQETNSVHITPDIAAQIILFAFILNVIVFGFKSIRQVI